MATCEGSKGGREIHTTFLAEKSNRFKMCPPGCCSRVKVGFTRGQRGGAFKLHPYMYTYYRREPGVVNGRNHYTSDDGRFAISYCGDSWWIQREDTRYTAYRIVIEFVIQSVIWSIILFC